MVVYEILSTPYSKLYFYKQPYPNIYRDELRSTPKVYANQDYVFKRGAKSGKRKYSQLWGGLIKPVESIKEGWVWNDDDPIIMNSLIEEPIPKNELAEPRRRALVGLKTSRQEIFLPSLHTVMKLSSNVGNHMYNAYASSIRPDPTFIKCTQEALMMLYQSKPYEGPELYTVALEPGLTGLKYFTTEMRDSTIRNLALLIELHGNVGEFTYENGELGLTDGVRILVAIALGAGETLQYLNLYNLFAPGALPMKTESDYFDTYNELDYDPRVAYEIPEEHKVELWFHLLKKRCYEDIPIFMLDQFFFLSLCCLSSLSALTVNYNWLSKGNGLYLLRLECLRNGHLRNLTLFLTPLEHPNCSKQVICSEAWMEAINLCPGLELHFVFGRNVVRDDMNAVLVKHMPLASVHFSSVYPVTGLQDQKPWCISYASRFLRANFNNTLKMISMEVWDSTSRVDVSLRNMILECPRLQVFSYRGRIDKFVTLEQICEYLIHNDTNMKTIGFYILDEARQKKGCCEVVRDMMNKFEGPLKFRGITLAMGVWQL